MKKLFILAALIISTLLSIEVTAMSTLPGHSLQSSSEKPVC